MPRKASEVVFLKSDPTLPDGMETVEVKRTLKSVKPSNAPDSFKARSESVILTLDVPKVSAEGVIAYAPFYSTHANGDNDRGPVFIAEAIRNSIASAAAARIGLGQEGRSRCFIPPVSALKVVDKADIAADRFRSWSKENPGEVPTPQILKSFYAGII